MLGISEDLALADTSDQESQDPLGLPAGLELTISNLQYARPQAMQLCMATDHAAVDNILWCFQW